MCESRGIKSVATRRLKIMFIAPEIILSLLHSASRIGTIVSTRMLDLDAGTTFVSVHWDVRTRAFAVILHNDSWPECKDGDELEKFTPTMETVHLEIHDNGLWKMD